MIEVKDLKAPKDILDTEDRAADRAAVFIKARLKRLSDRQLHDIERKLKKWYEDWKKQTTPQRKRLVRYAELLDGIVEDSDVPFEGSSNITLHYAAGMTRTFRSNFNKTAYKDEDLFYPILSPQLRKRLENNPEKIKELEEGFNHSFSQACNGLKTLKEGTVPCVRDGTLVITGRWHREIRRCFDQRTYRDVEAFQKDYPDAEAAGVAEDAYLAILDFFLMHSDEEAKDENEKLDTPELIVGFEYDHVFKNEPEYSIGPWAKFVRYPLSATSIQECMFYGYMVVEDKESLQLKAKRGEYYERGVKKSLDGQAQEVDSWDKAMGFIEGITQPREGKDRPIQPIDGCCLLDLDNDGIPEKYLVKFDPESEALLSLIPHRLRRGRDASVVFRMVKRENRLDGISLIGDCEDLFTQIDFNTRHRNNVRILTTSPIFLAQSKYKDQIDLGRAENVIRPGVTYWVDDTEKAITQLPIQDLSATMDNMDELKLYKEHVELVFGPTQGMSGMQTPDDPRAPARKTQLLMTQAGGRLDDYLDQFMESAPELADVHAALLFQFAEGPEIEYSSDSKEIKIPLDILGDPGVKWGVKRRSYQLTPEFSMARLASLQQMWMSLLPLIARQDPIAKEMWNRMVMASGEPQADKFLLSGETLQLVQQSFQMAAQQDPNNADAQAKLEGKKSFHREMGKKTAEHLTGSVPTAEPVGAGQSQNGKVGSGQGAR